MDFICWWYWGLWGKAWKLAELPVPPLAGEDGNIQSP